MFDDKTFEQMRSGSDNETEIGALYREYIRLGDEADPELVAAHARCSSLEAAISDTASSGPAGLAVKIYIETFHEHGCRSADPCEIGKHKDQRINETLLSALRDACRFLPELAPLCAAVLESEREARS